ncbi:hypothetical protein B7494_g4232 [Chlorociboria aeruginascens]|nr:hypothetical protein B7494_g4232 [Chlorociboria aeruginascens]
MHKADTLYADTNKEKTIESIEDVDSDSDGESDDQFTREPTVIRPIKESFKIDNPDFDASESYLDRKIRVLEKELEKELDWEFEKQRAAERAKREIKIELDKDKNLGMERELKRSPREAEKDALKYTSDTRDKNMMVLDDELGDILDDFYDSKPEKESITEEIEDDHNLDYLFEPGLE